MTQLAEPPARRPEAPPPPNRTGSGRWAVVVTLIVAMVCCEWTQNWAMSWKLHNGGAPPLEAERGALSGMDSYALALMLGGLRGPLVMILWTKVENQKIDRNLEDVDTMIEWIRLLQPEFDTVHIFQIWNKAYNISALMASSASKYEVILDALDYGRRVERDRPGDLNINDSLARVCGEKLGSKTVAEGPFYRLQFRQDSMTDANRAIAYPEETHYRRMGFKFISSRNGPLLDDHNRILPELITPLHPRPADLPADSDWDNGSELQYLAPYQPFPYGISPAAMGYNYAKRAQVAMTVGGQIPVQISDMVVDSRPGVLMRQWAEEEADRGVRYEARAFGLSSKEDAPTLEASTGPIAPDAKLLNLHDAQAAVYSYRLSSRLCDAAYREYERHLANPQYVNPYLSYTSQLEEIKGMHDLALADNQYLSAFLPGADRPALLSQAADNYRLARAVYQRDLLKYSTEEAIAGPLYRDLHVDLDRLNDDELEQMYLRVMAAAKQMPPRAREYDEQRADSGVYIGRADGRLRLLGVYSAPSLMQIH